MRRLPGLLVGGLVWVAVVAVVALVTWLVISRAGEEVAQVATPPRVATNAASRTGGPTNPAGGTGTRSPVQDRTSATTPAAGTPRSTPPTPPSAPSMAGFTVTGGTVSATCVDGRPQVRSVTPRNGYSFEISRDETLEVTFHGGGNLEDDEVRVRCENGVPRLLSG